MSSGHRCLCCDEVLIKGKDDWGKRFEDKKFCGRSCFNKYNSKRRIERNIGVKYNKLTIISVSEKSGNYNCVCDCGKETIVNITKMKTGHTKSCGCSRSKNNRDLKLTKEIGYGVSMFNEVLRQYKRSAKKRNIEYKLSRDQFLETITKPCNYCGRELTNMKKTSRLIMILLLLFINESNQLETLNKLQIVQKQLNAFITRLK
jgi:hypothetical protein